MNTFPKDFPVVCVGGSAVAGPKNATSTSRLLQLDGSKSTSADGKPLAYLWTIPQGSPLAAILGGTTATRPLCSLRRAPPHTHFSLQLRILPANQPQIL